MLSVHSRRFLQRAVNGAYGTKARDVVSRAVKLMESSGTRTGITRPRVVRLHETTYQPFPPSEFRPGGMSPAQVAAFIRGGSPVQHALRQIGAALPSDMF